jgi:hypothetical protein
MADQLATDIFGGPTQGMPSNDFISHTATTMPSLFESSLYTRPGSHWAQPHDHTPLDIGGH